MSTLIAILIVVALFVVFGVLKPKVGCSGDCGACGKNTCSTSKANHDHD